MTEHPLTDTKCRDIANNLCFRWLPHVDQGEVLYAEDDMRAAADWQLEQVIKALNQCKEEKRSCIEVIYLFHQKLEAMRPGAYAPNNNT